MLGADSSNNQALARLASADAFDVRRFSVRARMSHLFEVDVVAVSENLDVDFDELVGQEASFELITEWARTRWTGICEKIEQIRVDAKGLATYAFTIVPKAWLLTQRTNYRIFQYQSDLDIATQVLGEWGVPLSVRASAGNHKGRKYRVQYAESDFAFVSRLLEDTGISYSFETVDGVSTMVLDDEAQSREVLHPNLVYRDAPGVTDGRFATKVAIQSRMRPGKMAVGDVDYRRDPSAQPSANAGGGLASEAALEQFDFEPGAFLMVGGSGGSTPTADDRGSARTDDEAAARKTENWLLGRRAGAREISFESNVLELQPGALLSITGHPHRRVGEDHLVLAASIAGTHDAAWRVLVTTAPASVPHRPARVTPKPVVRGLESATVVGPGGEEIYTDEYGRVRVHFHWDRESQRDETSSCWLPVNQPWAGKGFGGVSIPRIGQEVLVEFINADPDRPVVIGRVYTEENPVPDQLPKYKNVSGLMSDASPRMVMGSSTGPGTTPGQGYFGGTPLSPSQVSSRVTQSGPFKALSPTGSNHAWKGSALKADDTSGAENLYLQANNDFHIVVWNDMKTLVGNHRATEMGTDDILEVVKDQTITIGVDQETEVTGESLTKVKGRRSDSVGQKFTQTATKGIAYTSNWQGIIITSDKEILFDDEKGIDIRLGKSLIKLTPDEITVQSGGNNVQINPDKG